MSTVKMLEKIVISLRDDIERKDEALETVLRGLHSGMVTSKPLMILDENATKCDPISLESIIEKALK